MKESYQENLRRLLRNKVYLTVLALIAVHYLLGLADVVPFLNQFIATLMLHHAA